MAKENSTQVERLLDLVPYLLAHQGISLTELASAFSVSTREITKDLNTLWMCGLPGYTPLELIDLEFESGFVTIGNAETLQSPRALTKIEALSLLIGLDILAKDGVDVEKLKERLSRVLGKAIAVSVDSQSGSKNRGVLSAALSKKVSIEISYHSIRTDSMTVRTVTPIELVIDDGREYLLAFCHQAQSHRSFRVDRISSAKLSSERPQVPSTLEAVEVIEMAVDFSSPSRSIQERFSLSVEDAGRPSLVLSAFSAEWATRSILACAGDAILRTPLALRAQIKERAQQAISLYK